MTEKQFAEITVKIWRLRKRVPALRADIRKRGLTLARRNGDVGINPSVAKLTKLFRSLDVLAASLGRA